MSLHCLSVTAMTSTLPVGLNEAALYNSRVSSASTVKQSMRSSARTKPQRDLTPRPYRAHKALRYVCMTQCNRCKHLLPRRVFTHSAAALLRAL